MKLFSLFLNIYSRLFRLPLSKYWIDRLGFAYNETKAEICQKSLRPDSKIIPFPFILVAVEPNIYRLSISDFSESLLARNGAEFLIRDFKYVHELQEFVHEITLSNPLEVNKNTSMKDRKDIFRYFIKKVFPEFGDITSIEDIDMLGEEFQKYLDELPAAVKEKIMPKSAPAVLLLADHPTKHHGFEPGYVLHFTTWVAKMKTEPENG
jgi:hypothetical protein